MGVLANINQSFNEIEERLRYFIHHHASIEFVEVPIEYAGRGTFGWARLKPNEQYLQSHVLSDYSKLLSVCNLILKNVNSPYIEEFEKSSELVLSYIGQNTLLFTKTLENVFADIKEELDVQRSIIAEPYQ
jgi:hypothetical protein